MNLANFVEAERSRFGYALKLAMDIAKFIDDTVFDLNRCQKKDAADVALEKIKLFCSFRRICNEALVTPPMLPGEALEAILPAKETITQHAWDIISKIEHKQIDDREWMCARIKDFVEICPWFVSGLSADQALAFINLSFMDWGYGNVDWEAPYLGCGASGISPSKPLSILVVDDCLNEIVRTFYAIAGCSNITIGVRLVRVSWDDAPSTVLAHESQEIRALNPDIVLMDQGIGPIKGSNLIYQIRRDDPESRIIFVGNTGGNLDDLQNAGAIGNFNKGRARADCINTAIRRANSR